MALNFGKKTVWNNWGLIPMPDMVIASINTLGSDQPKRLTFTDRHVHITGDVETPGLGEDSDEVDVDDEPEKEEMEIPDMEPEGNAELPGVDMEGQEPPPQVVEIDDLSIPQDSSLIVPKVPAYPDTGHRRSTHIHKSLVPTRHLRP